MTYSSGPARPCYVLLDCPVPDGVLERLVTGLSQTDRPLSKVELLNWALSYLTPSVQEDHPDPLLDPLVRELRDLTPMTGTTLRVIEYCPGTLFAEVLHAVTPVPTGTLIDPPLRPV